MGYVKSEEENEKEEKENILEGLLCWAWSKVAIFGFCNNPIDESNLLMLNFFVTPHTQVL